MNIFDYLYQNGNIPLKKINELDVLIFNRISYLPLEELMNSKEKISIEDIYKRSLNKKLAFSNSSDKKILSVIAKSSRYQKLMLNHFESNFDLEKEEQFAAVTINLPKNCLFISFRGTTKELLGWKEDFNMSYLSPIPAQESALLYLNKVNRFKKIYLGGHSKGGNLAIYAGTNTTDKIKKRIIKIYNYDGPGFLELDNNYYSMQNKIVSYIPSSSVVGRLLSLDNNTIVVATNTYGILQHNLYSWKVSGDSFVLSKLTPESDKIKSTIDEWINTMDKETSKDFIDNIYSIITSTEVSRIDEVNVKDLIGIIMSYKNIDDHTKKMLSKIINQLFISAKDNIKVR